MAKKLTQIYTTLVKKGDTRAGLRLRSFCNRIIKVIKVCYYYIRKYCVVFSTSISS